MVTLAEPARRTPHTMSAVPASHCWPRLAAGICGAGAALLFGVDSFSLWGERERGRALGLPMVASSSAIRSFSGSFWHTACGKRSACRAARTARAAGTRGGGVRGGTRRRRP